MRQSEAMRIAVIGASGWLGGTIAREAMARGHQVTAIARHADRLADLEGADIRAADATDAEALVGVISDQEVVVASVTDRSTPDRSVIPAIARALISAAPAAGVSRIAFVGGGGSLLAPDGNRFVDSPDFPAEYKTEALAGAEALELLRSAPAALDWTYLSPPAHDLRPGDKQGGYQVRGDDRPVTAADGTNSITSGDLAAALVDELEHPRFSRRRFTAGYAP
jgi:putative NADH-flavin reductase